MKRRDFLTVTAIAAAPGKAFVVFPMDYAVPPKGLLMPPPDGWMTVNVKQEGTEATASFKTPLFAVGAHLDMAAFVPLSKAGVTEDSVITITKKDD